MNPQLMGVNEWWKMEAQSTTRMIEAIPAEKIGKKFHDKIKPMNQIAHHITQSISSMLDCIEKGQFIYPPEGDAPDNVKQLVENYKSVSKNLLERMTALTEEQLSRKIPFEMGGKVIWEPTGMEMLQAYVCHEIHHRAQLGMLVRMSDGIVPGIYGGTADDMET